MLPERLAAQGLTGPPARSAVDVVERLLAVQGQDPRGFRLAVRARSTGLGAADVDRALTEERSLVVDWLHRGTLHLVRSEDHPWLHAVTAPGQLAAARTRLADDGLDEALVERGAAAIERALADRGPLVRAELVAPVEEAGIAVRGQVLYHLLSLVSLRGVVVRAPVAGGEQAYVLVRDWLDPPYAAAVDRDAALAELARRFLAGHGPADDRDLARWVGIGLRDARAGLAAIAGELVERADGLVTLRRPGEPTPALPPPRLLGPFDPVLFGWVSRDPVLGPEAAAVVTRNGIFRAMALVDGRAVATWTMPRGQVVLAPFAALPAKVERALLEDAADVRRFLAR